jgi:hypothetical protein
MARAAEEGALRFVRREKSDKQRTNHHADEHFCTVEFGRAARGDERNAACAQVRATFLDLQVDEKPFSALCCVEPVLKRRVTSVTTIEQ